MRKYDNYCEVVFDAISTNVAFARMVVSGFVLSLDPTVDMLSELKTVVSEAVTNAIIHGYENRGGRVKMTIGIKDYDVYVTITDYGRGIPDVKQACELFFTTAKGEERSGMGLTIMEAFSDEFSIESQPGQGTTIKVKKCFSHPMISDD